MGDGFAQDDTATDLIDLARRMGHETNDFHIRRLTWRRL